MIELIFACTVIEYMGDAELRAARTHVISFGRIVELTTDVTPTPTRIVFQNIYGQPSVTLRASDGRKIGSMTLRRDGVNRYATPELLITCIRS